MALNSVTFIFCALPILVAVYYPLAGLFGDLARGVRKCVLLVASVLLYAWVAADYIPLLVAVVLANWLLGLLIGRCREARAGGARAFVFLAVAIDVMVLVFYKYFDFFGSQISSLLNIEYVETGLLQPLGISFLSFSLISYVVDVYRGIIDADGNLLNVALWAFFFPKLSAGPISRYRDMYSEENLHRAGRFDKDTVAYGFRRFVIGLGKKAIIADTLGVTVDAIWQAQAATGIDAPTAWLGIICYTFQIFFDFAGYSDMALGIAALFGYRLKENFEYPYVAKTLGEFWHRWHISLSSWLRDYVYFPLGGNRRGNVYVNLFITFVLSGLWHGAAWTFIVWGFWYAMFMVVDRLYRKVPDKWRLPAWATWLFTMIVVVVGWVFFRASGLHQALAYLQTMFLLGGGSTQFFAWQYYLNGRIAFLLVVSVVLSTPIIARARERFEGTVGWEALRLVLVPLLFVVSVMFLVNGSYSPALYAQF